MNARRHSLTHVGFFAALLSIVIATGSQAAPITKSATGTDLTAGLNWTGSSGTGTVGDVETVTITLTPVPASTKLFVQVRAQ